MANAPLRSPYFLEQSTATCSTSMRSTVDVAPSETSVRSLKTLFENKTTCESEKWFTHSPRSHFYPQADAAVSSHAQPRHQVNKWFVEDTVDSVVFKVAQTAQQRHRTVERAKPIPAPRRRASSLNAIRTKISAVADGGVSTQATSWTYGTATAGKMELQSTYDSSSQSGFEESPGVLSAGSGHTGEKDGRARSISSSGSESDNSSSTYSSCSSDDVSISGKPVTMPVHWGNREPRRKLKGLRTCHEEETPGKAPDGYASSSSGATDSSKKPQKLSLNYIEYWTRMTDQKDQHDTAEEPDPGRYRGAKPLIQAFENRSLFNSTPRKLSLQDFCRSRPPIPLDTGSKSLSPTCLKPPCHIEFPQPPAAPSPVHDDQMEQVDRTTPVLSTTPVYTSPLPESPADAPCEIAEPPSPSPVTTSIETVIEVPQVTVCSAAFQAESTAETTLLYPAALESQEQYTLNKEKMSESPPEISLLSLLAVESEANRNASLPESEIIDSCDNENDLSILSADISDFSESEAVPPSAPVTQLRKHEERYPRAFAKGSRRMCQPQSLLTLVENVPALRMETLSVEKLLEDTVSEIAASARALNDVAKSRSVNHYQGSDHGQSRKGALSPPESQMTDDDIYSLLREPLSQRTPPRITRAPANHQRPPWRTRSDNGPGIQSSLPLPYTSTDAFSDTYRKSPTLSCLSSRRQSPLDIASSRIDRLIDDNITNSLERKKFDRTDKKALDTLDVVFDQLQHECDLLENHLQRRRQMRLPPTSSIDYTVAKQDAEPAKEVLEDEDKRKIEYTLKWLNNDMGSLIGESKAAVDASPLELDRPTHGLKNGSIGSASAEVEAINKSSAESTLQKHNGNENTSKNVPEDKRDLLNTLPKASKPAGSSTLTQQSETLSDRTPVAAITVSTLKPRMTFTEDVRPKRLPVPKVPLDLQPAEVLEDMVAELELHAEEVEANSNPFPIRAVPPPAVEKQQVRADQCTNIHAELYENVEFAARKPKIPKRATSIDRCEFGALPPPAKQAMRRRSISRVIQDVDNVLQSLDEFSVLHSRPASREASFPCRSRDASLRPAANQQTEQFTIREPTEDMKHLTQMGLCYTPSTAVGVEKPVPPPRRKKKSTASDTTETRAQLSLPPAHPMSPNAARIMVSSVQLVRDTGRGTIRSFFRRFRSHSSDRSKTNNSRSSNSSKSSITGSLERLTHCDAPSAPRLRRKAYSPASETVRDWEFRRARG